MYRSIPVVICCLLAACGSELNQTAPTDSTRDLEAAWENYYEAVRTVQETFTRSGTFNVDAAHRAGAYELLQSIISTNVTGMMRGGTGEYPHIRLMLSPSVRLGVDNPDTLYRAATISNPTGDYRYRLWGQRGNAADFLVEIFDGTEPEGAISILDDNDMVFGPDGFFEIFLAAQPAGDNHLKLEATDKLLTLIIRGTFSDWQRQTPSTVHIERLGSEGNPSPDASEAALIRQIETATQILLRQGTFWPEFSSRITLLGDNRFMDFRATESLGIISQYFSAGFFSLNENEALVIRVDDVPADYRGLHVANLWGSSPDWMNRLTSLPWGENGEAWQAEDGRYYFVLSARDTGWVNWLDTTGLSQGILYFRIQSPNKRVGKIAAPTARLVPLKALESVLPEGMPRVSEQARRAQLRARQAHVRRRYQTW